MQKAHRQWNDNGQREFLPGNFNEITLNGRNLRWTQMFLVILWIWQNNNDIIEEKFFEGVSAGK